VRDVDGVRIWAALRVLDADPQVWGTREDDVPYPHGLMIDPTMGGQGLESALPR